VPAAPSSTTSESKSNPFGAARPIDTSAREKEVEEKRELAIRLKKEAEDKAREEKKKETAEKAGRESVPPTPIAETSREKDAEGKPAANYEILRRAGDGEAGEPEEEDGTGANGEIAQDTAVKPKEVVRDPPKTEGAWRRKSDAPAAPSASTTEPVEDDGWSTVTKPKTTKSTRGGRGGPPARAVAS